MLANTSCLVWQVIDGDWAAGLTLCHHARWHASYGFTLQHDAKVAVPKDIMKKQRDRYISVGRGRRTPQQRDEVRPSKHTAFLPVLTRWRHREGEGRCPDGHQCGRGAPLLSHPMKSQLGFEVLVGTSAALQKRRKLGSPLQVPDASFLNRLRLQGC